jgi:DNA-binding LacI/PurR family transcriptional regulator
VFCQSDEMAFGALRALRRSGLRCPEDISIVGVDNHELAHTFDLTTVAQPVAAQGAGAAQWLLDLLAGQDPGEGDEVTFHEVRLVLRGTSGRPATT